MMSSIGRLGSRMGVAICSLLLAAGSQAAVLSVNNTVSTVGTNGEINLGQDPRELFGVPSITGSVTDSWVNIVGATTPINNIGGSGINYAFTGGNGLQGAGGDGLAGNMNNTGYRAHRRARTVPLTYTLSNISIPNNDPYSLIVYLGYSKADAPGTPSVAASITDGTTTYYAAAGASVYNQVTPILSSDTDVSNGVDVGNYVVFNNLTASSVTFTLTSLDITGATGDPGIAAFQIVAIPEPGSMALAGLGAVAVLTRRRGR